MDLGLVGRTVRLIGEGALARGCAAAFAREGAVVTEAPDSDIVVTFAPGITGGSLDAVDTAAAFAAWEHVTGLVERLRPATEAMASRGWGRVVWVGPVDAKLTPEADDGDMAGLVGLGALGLLKAMSGELGPDGITCNSVLWDGSDETAATAAVLFLASVPGGYVTGTAMTVDGGRSGSMF